MNDQQKQVRLLINKFDIKQVTDAELRQIITVFGYTIIEFSLEANDDDVECLLNSLALKHYAKTFAAFSYADQYMRLVFIRTGLSEEENAALLAHELGHIWNKHFSRPGILGEEIEQEQEANRFLYYLLDESIYPKANRYWTRHKKGLVAVLASCAVLICFGVNFNAIYGQISVDEPTKISAANLSAAEDVEQKYWITSSGSKYHIRSCSYLKDKDDSISCLSLSVLKEMGYEPCSVCIKEE